MVIFYSFIIVVVEGIITAKITNCIDRYVDLHINVTIIVGIFIMLITTVIFMMIFAIKKKDFFMTLTNTKNCMRIKKN